jgi:phosphonate degradation associated HDIG domain protein
MAAGGEILRLLREGGGQAYYGESVTQLEHALQSAQLARDAGADDDVVTAALLHDIGHLLDTGRLHERLGVIDHDRAGADFLRTRGFPEKIVSLVEGHVQAKRYLVATNPAYAAKLSPSSTATLELQGGPMSAGEAAAFERDPLFRDNLRLRAWDEQAKVPGAKCAPLEDYEALIARFAS